MSKDKTVPSVLSFEKKLVPSDGYMYGTTWDKRGDAKAAAPLRVQEKSVRGTISNRLSASQSTDEKLRAAIENPNLQTVDNCALGVNQDTLQLNFTLKVLGGVQYPSACNNDYFKTTYQTAVEKYITEEGFRELARRYAINLANARFLWRNRVGAENI